MKTITRAQAVTKIEKAKETGHFCSAKVLKRTADENGVRQMRTFNFRGGVRKGVKGVGLPFSPNKHKLICIWDKQAIGGAGAFRMIAIEGIQELQIEGEKFEVK